MVPRKGSDPESKCEMFPSWLGDLGALVRKKLCWGSSRSRVTAPGLVPGGEAAPAPLGQSFVACCYQQFPTRETITCPSLQSRKDLLLFYLAGSVTGIQHELCWGICKVCCSRRGKKNHLKKEKKERKKRKIILPAKKLTSLLLGFVTGNSKRMSSTHLGISCQGFNNVFCQRGEEVYKLGWSFSFEHW